MCLVDQCNGSSYVHWQYLPPNGTTVMENSMQIPQKMLEIQLSYDSAIPLLCIYPRELKSGSQKDICTLMFIAEHYL